VSGFASLLKLAERRAEAALLLWQRLNAQYADAKDKLSALERHGVTYRDRLDAGLQQGAAAGSVTGHLGFIGQIEAVAAQQQGELGQIEAARAQHWQELLSLRREKRMYEILGERVAARAAVQARHRQQTALDEWARRAASGPPPMARQSASDEWQRDAR
jgi:flagellar export protein FliJ